MISGQICSIRTIAVLNTSKILISAISLLCGRRNDGIRIWRIWGSGTLLVKKENHHILWEWISQFVCLRLRFCNLTMFRCRRKRSFSGFLHLKFRQFVRAAGKFPGKFIVVISEPWLICRCQVWQFDCFVRSRSSFAAIANVPVAYLLNACRRSLKFRLAKQTVWAGLFVLWLFTSAAEPERK